LDERVLGGLLGPVHVVKNQRDRTDHGREFFSEEPCVFRFEIAQDSAAPTN
jgi:hypothetical protein